MHRILRPGIVFFALIGSSTLADDLHDRCATAQQKAIEFLATNQSDTGGFATYEWREFSPRSNRIIDTPFTTSQVLYSLLFGDDNATARRVSERCVDGFVR